jgi:hypothetical protein
MSVYQSPDARFDLVIENLESLRGRIIACCDYVDSCAQYLYAICFAQRPYAETGDKGRLSFLEEIPQRQGGDEFYIMIIEMSTRLLKRLRYQKVN